MTAIEKRRILFLAPLPPPYGGVAAVSYELLHSALRDTFETSVINLSKSGENREQINRLDIRSVYHPLAIWATLIWRILTFRPRVVYVVSTSDYSFMRDIFLMATAKAFGRTVVCHLHGRRMESGLFSGASPISRALLRRSRLLFDKILFLSDGLRQSLEPYLGTGKSAVIPNFVDPAKFQVARNPKPTNKRMVFLGRPSKAKGIFDLLDALKHLHARGHQVYLDVIGVGETQKEEASVHVYAEHAGVGALVVFHGLKEGPAKSAILSQASLFVLPSKMEIFPVAILEAYASGLPVVSTKVGAIPEVVHHGINGFLSEPGDVEALGRNIAKLLEEDSLRETMGKANRSLAESSYSKDYVVQRAIAILNTLTV